MEVKFPIAFKFTIYFLGIFAFLYFLYIAQDILVPVVFGLCLSMVMYPACRQFEKMGMRRVPAILVSLVLISIFIGSLLYLITTQFVGFAQELPTLAEKLGVTVTEWYTSLADMFNIDTKDREALLQDSIQDFVNNSSSYISQFFSTTTGVLAFLLLIPIYMFLFLLYRSQFKIFLLKITAKEKHDELNEVLKKIQDLLRSYIWGLGLMILILSILNTLGFALIGLDYSLFFGVFVGVLTIIPYVGLAIGSIPPVLMAMTTDTPGLSTGLAILVIFIVQIIIGNFLNARFLGSKVNVNALSVFLALFVGAKIWGAAGLILAIPMIAILKVFFDAIESLAPIGYLLGDESEKGQKPSLVKRLFNAMGINEKVEELKKNIKRD